MPASPPRVDIHAAYTVQNSGTTDLSFIDVDFPDEKDFGRTDLRAECDGHQTTLDQLPEEYRQDHPNTLRIAFDSPWRRGQTHQLDLQYSFVSPSDSGELITISSDAFHLGSQRWTARPQPPRHLLAPFPARPDKTTYSVRVPSDFVVLGRGKLSSRKRQGNETEYVFQLRKSDLAAYVVAGRYVQTAFHESSNVIFWTLHPLNGTVGDVPQRIASAWTTLEQNFGPVNVTGPAPRVVEAPSLRARIAGEPVPVAYFPGGALVNEETLVLGLSSDAFFARVSHALAHNWFSDQMYPTGASGLGMREGLPEYATTVIDEATGGERARKQRIQAYLRLYADAIKQTQEKPLGVTGLTDPPEERAIALAKAPLMYVALEDTCGEAPVRKGLRRLVTLLRGQQVGFDDMRSAIEQTCGKDLGEFFREWLYNKGLPPDFRARYAQAETIGEPVGIVNSAFDLYSLKFALWRPLERRHLDQ